VSLTYLLINVGIILGPLSFTWHPRLSYNRSFPALAISILIVGSGYIFWDMWATEWGEWSFNPRYVSGAKIVNLPVEEILFFITVPYACLFIYEALLASSRRATFDLPVGVVAAVAALLGAASIAYLHQGYTSKALGACATFLLIALALDRSLLSSREYWLWLALCQIPFVVVNSILTALPVVRYHPSAIWGLRLVTIPLEDFFYNYSLLSFYLLAYRLAKRRLPGYGSAPKDLSRSLC
jgi:lycopene cyclase domain-containing protein